MNIKGRKEMSDEDVVDGVNAVELSRILLC